MQIPKIDLVVQCLPPAHDAIGEYTFFLAEELAKRAKVQVLTGRAERSYEVNGATTIQAFQLDKNRNLMRLANELQRSAADAIVLQYNPFGWGKRGWAPDLVNAIRRVKKACPDSLLAVMFHETYTMSPGLRAWLMRQYQRKQFNDLVALADISFFSTELWVIQQRARYPNRTMVHLPVGANMPANTSNTELTRNRLGIASNEFVCGVFGGAHPSRMVPWIRSAIQHIYEELKSQRVVLLHIGGEQLDWAGVPCRVVCTGRLDAQEASQAIATMDVLINPLTDGVSTRRGSVMAALQNGVPVLTTQGHATDSIWRTVDGELVFLAGLASEVAWLQKVDEMLPLITKDRVRLRSEVSSFYRQNFDWSVVANSLLDVLVSSDRILS